MTTKTPSKKSRAGTTNLVKTTPRPSAPAKSPPSEQGGEDESATDATNSTGKSASSNPSRRR
jgi:hypothetical protein